MENKIEAKNLDLYYGEKHALKNVSLNIKTNKITAFIGPSGCGKSTFLKTLNRMNDYVKGIKITGDVKLDGEDIYDSRVDTTVLRKKVGMVFQQPNPFPMSIYDNVAYGPRIHGIKNKKELDKIVKESLEAAALYEEVKDRLNTSALGLSGGQQQRLCIARALAVQPEVILLDEPTSGLDPLMQNKFVELIKRAKAEGKTVLMSSHIFEEIENTCDRVVMIKDGKIVASKEMALLKKDRHKCYEISFNNLEDAISFNQLFPNGKLKDKTVTLIMQGQINDILKSLTQYSIDDISIRAQSLEELFLHYYGGGN